MRREQSHNTTFLFDTSTELRETIFRYEGNPSVSLYQTCHINLYPRPTNRRFYFSGTNGKTIIRTLASEWANNNKIESRSEDARRLVQSTGLRFIFMKIGIKFAGQRGPVGSEGPGDRTPDRLLHIVSYKRGRLENIASGHNFLYATMTLQKVVGELWIT